MSDWFEYTPTEEGPWMETLERAHGYDFYHRPDYHRLSEGIDGGTAHLFGLRRDSSFIALPLIIRPIENVQSSEQLYDATSVYGYAGPIASGATPPRPLVEDFHVGLTRELTVRNVVSAFSRLNSNIDQEDMLKGLGEVREVGSTVAIDLSISDTDRIAKYRTDHRRAVRKLHQSDFECNPVTNPNPEEFGRLYRENMRRIGAAEYYLFKDSYFSHLFSFGEPRPQVFECRLGGDLAAAAIFLRQKDHAQYHLGATAAEFLPRAPLKLLLDTAASVLSTQGVRSLHLGGGVGGQEDGLFRFKQGFSRNVKPFTVWRWVVDESNYAMLARTSGGGDGLNTTSFPAYRY